MLQVERLLDGVDAVIYLLDYTKLRTKDEAELFKRLKQINPGTVTNQLHSTLSIAQIQGVDLHLLRQNSIYRLCLQAAQVSTVTALC